MSTTTRTEEPKQSKGFVFPHTYAIILGIIAIATALTYIIPAGEFETETREVNGVERNLVVDGSYQQVEQQPVNPFEMFQAIPNGLEAGAQIVFYIFLVAGAFAVIRETGAIEGLVDKLIKVFGKKDMLLIPVLMTTFSVLGFTVGMAEEAIVFVPIVIAIMWSFGYDRVTGAAIVILGAAAGFSGGMFNPFTVGIAQGIAEVQLFSGWQFRLVPYFFFLTAAILYVMRYARSVRTNPERSVVAALEKERLEDNEDGGADELELRSFTTTHGIVLGLLLAAIGVNMWGIFTHGWFLVEMTAVFIILALVAGLVGGLGVNGTFDAFIDGMKGIVFGAIIVGFARAILVVLEEGVIIHTILDWASGLLSALPGPLIAVGMFFTQTVLNLFIPSGSGQAATTMPIMAPLSDLVGVDRQVAVLAFQYGDGLSNSIIPTSAALLASLAIANIPYEKWVKFLWPLTLIWIVIAAIAVVVAEAIGLT